MTTILHHALSPLAADLLAEIQAMANTHGSPIDVSCDDPSTIAELVEVGFLAQTGNVVEVTP